MLEDVNSMNFDEEPWRAKAGEGAVAGSISFS
jgi:hypothetical protein